MIGKRYLVADFFCGCGGLSFGFATTRRFDVILGSDIKPEALSTFAANHRSSYGEPETIGADIRTVSPEDVLARLHRFGVRKPGDLDCLIGGPPCEGFSQNRSINAGGLQSEVAATRVNRFIDDPRNELFRWYVELAAYLQPKVVLIENVPDLVRHKGGETLQEILSALNRAGYVATARVLNAADYGVPQMRRRAIFLAQRKVDYSSTAVKLAFPSPTHVPFPLQHDELERDRSWMPGDSGYWPSVWEAVGDLPPPTMKGDASGIELDYGSHAASSLRQFLRSSSGQMFNHVARPLGKNGLEKVQALSGGQRAADLPEHLRPKASYHFSYSRLRWSEPARTITKFCYHVGSGMFTHPEEDRAITIREAARIQTFPDNFRFLSENIRDLASMVGSAVPPLLANKVAIEVCRYLDQLQLLALKPDDRDKVRPQATDAVMRRLESSEWRTDEEKEKQASMFQSE